MKYNGRVYVGNAFGYESANRPQQKLMLNKEEDYEQ